MKGTQTHFKNFIYIKNHFVLKALQECAQESDKEQLAAPLLPSLTACQGQGWPRRARAEEKRRGKLFFLVHVELKIKKGISVLHI